MNIPDIIKENWEIKLVSLIIALIVFYISA